MRIQSLNTLEDSMQIPAAFLFFFFVRCKGFLQELLQKSSLVGRIYTIFLVFLHDDFLTLLHFFTFLISFYSFYNFRFEPLAPD